MVTSDTSKRFTARQALQEFQKIRSQLSSSQLNSLVTNRFWDKGTPNFFQSNVLLIICRHLGNIKTKLQRPTELGKWQKAPLNPSSS